MGLLNSVLNKPNTTALKGIIYGTPGIGKTTFGASAPNSLILDFENGAGRHAGRTPPIQTFDKGMEWLNELDKTDHQYKTIVIDTIDWLLRKAEDDVCDLDRGLTLNSGANSFGVGKQKMEGKIFNKLMPLLDRMVANGVNVILLAHSDRQKQILPNGTKIEKNAPAMHTKLRDGFIQWADFCCFVLEQKDGRFLQTVESEYTVAKNKLNFPQLIPFRWVDFYKEFQKVQTK